MIGGRIPFDVLRRQVRALTSVYSLDRQQDTDSASQFGEETTYETDAATADLHLYRPQSRPEFLPEGVDTTGSLQGIALPEADVRERDRVEYAGRTYEVEAIDPVDHNGETQLLQLSLTAL
jgi:hypothetical protein